MDVEHILRRYQQSRIRSGGEAPKNMASSGKRVELTSYQRSIVDNENFPVKSRKMAGAIFAKGMDGGLIRKMIFNKVNPFKDATPAIMDICCDLLIARRLTAVNMNRGIIDRSQRSLSYKTVKSQASVAITTLMLMGVVERSGLDYILRRKK